MKGPIRGKPGIELIAGNDTTNMQPLVKGKNLVEALEQTLDVVNQLSNIVEYLAIAVQAGATGMIPSPTPLGGIGIGAFPAKIVGAPIAITYSTMAMSFLATFKANQEIQKLKNKYSLAYEMSDNKGYINICGVLQKYFDIASGVSAF